MTKKVSVVIAFLAAGLAIAAIFSGLPGTVNAACGELIGGDFDGCTGIILEGVEYCDGYMYCTMQWLYADGTREQEEPVILAAKDRGSDPKTGGDAVNLEFADRRAAPGFASSEAVSQSGITTKRSQNGDLYQKISSLFHKIGDYVKSSSDSDTLGERAAELAVQVIGAPYLGDGKTWGGKGYEWNPNTDSWVDGKFVEPDEIKNGYWYWNNKEGKVMWGRGLDCSGLSFWAFNKAAGATKMVDSSNPICSDRASVQWKDTAKFEQLSTKIPTVSDLEPGYLLFLDANSNGLADHVGMYVGNGEVVHSKWGVGVEKKTLKDWLDIPVTGGKYKNYFVGFGRVKQTSPPPDHEPKQNTIQELVEGYIGKFKSTLYAIYAKIEEIMSPVISTAGESVILFLGYALTGLIAFFLVRFIAHVFLHSENILLKALSVVTPVFILVVLYYLYEEGGTIGICGGILGVIVGFFFVVGR